MATLTIDYFEPLHAFTGSERAAIDAAAAVWGDVLTNDVDLLIRAVKEPSISALNLSALCLPNLRQGSVRIGGGDPGDVTLTTAQIKALGDVIPLEPREPDMLVIFDGKPKNCGDMPDGSTHLKTEVIHEICHGLGFVSLVNIERGQAVQSDPNLLRSLASLRPLAPFF